MSRNNKVAALALAILAFFIFVGSPFQVPAKALVVDASIIGIIIAALAAMGITITAAGSFGDVREYVEGLLQEYAETRGLTVNQLFDGVQTGSNKLGDILLNNRFVILIDTFAKWLINKFSLANNSNKVLVTPGASIDGLSLYQLPIVLEGRGVDDRGVMVLTSQESVFAAFGIEDNRYLVTNVISDGTARIRRGYVNDGIWSGTEDADLVYNQDYGLYYGRGYKLVLSYFQNNPYTYYQQTTIEDALRQNGIEATTKQINVSTGVIELPSDDPDYSNNPGAVLDVGAGWGSTYDDVTDYQIPVGYEDSTIEYQSEGTVADQVEDTPAQVISQEVSDYQVNGLVGVFPFCIPFDIYSFFECLAADPVAPHFVWRFYVPGICDEEIDLDLAQFDTVAQIVRTMELLAFIVGLAVVTRNRFLRG